MPGRSPPDPRAHQPNWRPPGELHDPGEGLTKPGRVLAWPLGELRSELGPRNPAHRAHLVGMRLGRSVEHADEHVVELALRQPRLRILRAVDEREHLT